MICGSATWATSLDIDVKKSDPTVLQYWQLEKAGPHPLHLGVLRGMSVETSGRQISPIMLATGTSATTILCGKAAWDVEEVSRAVLAKQGS